MPFDGLPTEYPYPYDASHPNAIEEYIAGEIYWYNLELTEIAYIPDNCKFLNCENNNLTYLPPLPNNGMFKQLNCTHNKLTQLPPLPDSIEILNCSRNNLTILPDLPDSLERLDCSKNPLEANYPNIYIFPVYVKIYSVLEFGICNRRLIAASFNVKGASI